MKLQKKVKLDRRLKLTVLIIGVFLGLALFPWPLSSSYGQFSGFDPSNLYIKSDPNFNVQINSSQITVTGAGPTSEIIHLALSNLPYDVSFKITVLNQSLGSNPIIICISYPLNQNRMELRFSPTDNFTRLDLYSQAGNLIRSRQLVQYSVGQPLSISTEIGAAQSLNESISISVSNQTAFSTMSSTSEIGGLLADQARLLSVEIKGSKELDPLLALDNQSLTVENLGKNQGNLTLTQSGSSFMVVPGNHAETYVEHVFDPPIDLNSFDSLVLTFNGSGTHEIFRFWYNTDWFNRAFFYIKDDVVGPQQILIPLVQSDDQVGKPTLDSVDRIGVDFPKTTGVWGLSDIRIGKVEYLTTKVAISDFNVDIKPDSLAYAPLTPVYLQVSVAIIIAIGSVAGLYFSEFLSSLKKIFGRIKTPIISRSILFVATFTGIFALYFVLFGLGDLAFDMFSQKLWSYDIVKYGLLSLYQRPAVTSAAAFFTGLGTQHAIFSYGPLLGLYYSLVGHVYFLFTPNPSAYDIFLTVVMKSFQTLATMGCGILVYKIMRLYNVSKRTSYFAMLAFLLNPLVIYDAAVWGHQDSVLIFFLFLSLWAYESRHPRVSYSAVAVAIMVKSTAIAPAALMVFLLIREFGVRKLLDGILAGLTTAMAILVPYIASGASPAMLFTSTLFRLFQFGTAALQLPRSAAVSPDGYNIWTLTTYFVGARSKDRMWYPDYVSTIFGISYLLAGEIIFILVALILIYLATKQKAKLSGSVPLLLAVLMLASTMFLTKTTARYCIFGVAYLILSFKIVSDRTKWFVVGATTFTSVFAMHGLLVYYTGYWLKIYPAMSPTIPINGLVLALYYSDAVITLMTLLNLVAFALLFVATIKELRRR